MGVREEWEMGCLCGPDDQEQKNEDLTSPLSPLPCPYDRDEISP